ncbi:carboxymuconolactone decarboxylase family protein [Micromonospora sp. NBC_01813]|uniref:carboxymuconolactone decarboxylase family protein n=1 Tax=Micromonospora sp. NBC_01813 TaxID=2975988 RepID=UPI002DDC4C2D|nr:carboxymuconolactone decarboxylase family protein [Micromonospora sp. NBC_01813]WSA10747.1 carboxymuconolactone decarboxylase family protein [Micromonospora sp. NBC_01813]
MNDETPRATVATGRARLGRTVYARNFGVDEDTAERMMTERAGQTYVAEAYEAAGGPGWNGDALTDRDRSIAVIAAFVASHIVDDRLDIYLDLARRNGIDDDGLTQLMILLTAYIGQPSPSAAMRAVRRARQSPPAPLVTMP